jgi:hypothetical protein
VRSSSIAFSVGALFVGVFVLLPATMVGGTEVSSAQTVTRFQAVTGDRLLVNKRASFPGRYVALDLGAPSISTRGRYGTFTVYVVTAADAEAQIRDLLADGHTGKVGTPGPGNIHWEPGTTLRGDSYWLAKRRYGANVVLWWIGSTPVKKTDATFRRLHKALTATTSY